MLMHVCIARTWVILNLAFELIQLFMLYKTTVIMPKSKTNVLDEEQVNIVYKLCGIYIKIFFVLLFSKSYCT